MNEPNVQQDSVMREQAHIPMWVYLLLEQEYGFHRVQTCMITQSSHQTIMPYSTQGINCLNQLLEEIND